MTNDVSEMVGRKLKVGDIVYISDIDNKQIIETPIISIDDKAGGLIEGRYMAAPLFMPNNSENINLSLRDACVDFGINVIHFMRLEF